MPKFTYPGVYVSEAPGGPPPISGVSPSTMAVVGAAKEGPLNEPTLVLGFPDFVRQFGGFDANSEMANVVNAFFSNGGQRAIVVRVAASDAAPAEGYLEEQQVGEAMVPSPSFDGTATFFTFVGGSALQKLPIKPGSLTITTSAGAGSENFSDNGNGTLTGSGGGSGTVDYETGEVTLTYASAPANGLTVTADYTYRTFRFEVKWPGAAGNEFRVRVTGDPNSEDKAAATFSRYVVEVQRESSDGAGDFQTQESFSGVSLTDPTDPSFLTIVVNDEDAGSDYVKVTALGNNEAPSALSGTTVSSEALSESPAYDGSTKEYTYTLANPVNPTSFSALFALAENGVAVGTGVAGNAQTAQLKQGAISDDADLLIDFGGGTETFSLTNPGDGSGALTGSGGGSGTVDFDTGGVSLTLGAAAAGGETITANWRYRPHTIQDDGSGNVSITSTTGPSNWILDPNGTNTLDYDGGPGGVGVLTLTWKETSNPLLGPSSTTVTVTQTADYATKPASAEVNSDLSGGLDGSPITRNEISAATLKADKKGLYALDKTDEILNIVIPDFQTDYLVSQDLIDYCDSRDDRFGIVWVPEGLTPQEAVTYKQTKLAKSSNRAAIYYPHVLVVDPLTSKVVSAPGGGQIAGIFARVDSARNVSKAPAGTTDGQLRGVVGLERSVTLDESGLLNENHVNALVQFPFTGRVVWGARTLEAGGEFPYIQMRRLFMFVEKSIFEATQIHVFESNTAAMRQRMKSQIESFLLSLHNSNHFAGASPAESFYVQDLTTENDVKQGIVRFEIGLAPNRPAEFISFVFKQKSISQ